MEDDDFEDLPEVDVRKFYKKPVKPTFATKKEKKKYTYNYTKPSEEVVNVKPIQPFNKNKKTFKSLKKQPAVARVSPEKERVYGGVDKRSIVIVA